MISRYKRKPVSQNLQIDRSLAKAIESHPLPEKLDVYSNCPYVNQSKVTLKCKSESDISDTSDNLGKETQVSCSESQSCVGLSSDSSSVISWGFDEFDQAATLQVQKIFSHIDEFLFEQKPNTLADGLQEECQQWASCFPHLRIKGKQILAPLDDGYSWHSSYPNEVSKHTSLSTSHARDSNELGIFGTKCPLTIAKDPNATGSFSVDKEEDDGEDEFGVIVSDGIIEEYLAFDSMEKKDELFEWKRVMSLDSLNMGYPPISPKYCMKEAILACLFDDVWREAVGCMQDLICRHWEESILDDERHDSAIKTARAESLTPYAPIQRLPLVLPPVPHFKIPAISPSLANRPHGGNHVTSRNMNNLMVIHGCPLQQRNLHLMEKVLDFDDKLSKRPTSAALSSGKSQTGRTLEHSCSSLSPNIPSARRRNPPRTLHPINSNPSRTGTPKIEELLRGMRLPTGNDQVPCSPVPFNRNNLLPPIGTSDQDHHFMPGSQRQTPDTSMGCSLTAYDSINAHQRRGSAGPDSFSIGVSGVSASASSIRWGHSSSKTEEDHPSGIPMKYPSRGGHVPRSKQGL